MNDVCAITEVILQENGIIRDKDGKFLGRLVEDTDAFALKYIKRGLLDAANVCQNVVDSGDYDGHQQYAAAGCRDKIRQFMNEYV